MLGVEKLRVERARKKRPEGVWAIVFLAVLFCMPVLAKNKSPESLEKHIALSVRSAPVGVFLSALFANTEYVVDVRSEVVRTISGDYALSLIHI